VPGPNYYVLNGGVKRERERETLSGKKLYFTCVGFWLGPQKVNPNCRKILNQETSDHDFAVLIVLKEKH
jgi:hypothetical protein